MVAILSGGSMSAQNRYATLESDLMGKGAEPSPALPSRRRTPERLTGRAPALSAAPVATAPAPVAPAAGDDGGDRGLADGRARPGAAIAIRAERARVTAPILARPKESTILPRSRLHLRRPRAHPVRPARALAVARFLPFTEHRAFLRLAARPARQPPGRAPAGRPSRPIARESPRPHL